MLLSSVCKFLLLVQQDSFLFIDLNKNSICQGLRRSSVAVVSFITRSNISHYKLVSLVLNEIELFYPYFL